MTVPLRVAVMGCVVNGPGEAREADLGVASGNGKGQIFVKGEVIKTVPESEIVETLIEEAMRLAEEMGEPVDEESAGRARRHRRLSTSAGGVDVGDSRRSPGLTRLRGTRLTGRWPPVKESPCPTRCSPAIGRLRPAPSSTSCDATIAAHPDAPGHRRHALGPDLPRARRAGRRHGPLAARPPGCARATASASGHRRAPTTSTSRSSASCGPAPPTCPSTPTTRRSAPTSSSARRGSPPSSVPGAPARVITHATPPRRVPSATSPSRRSLAPSTRPTTPGSSSRPGSTGVPKGVAVTHRSAAAFVDAESRIFLQPTSRIGPGDRVLAGLSVAFDASCEEMWLAWAHGACLVPAPRALVRTGMDLGPWLVAQGITVVSTVPTLAGAVAGRGPRAGAAAHLRR